MMSHPRIKRNYAVIGHGEGLVEFRSGGFRPRSYYLEDEISEQPLFDIICSFNGELTVKEIVNKMNVDHKEVENIVRLLKKENILEDQPTDAFSYYLNEMTALTEDQYFNVPKKDLVFLGDEKLCRMLEGLLEPFADKHQCSIHYYDENLVDAFIGTDSYWPEKPLLREEMIEKYKGWKNCFVVFLSKHFNPSLQSYFNIIAHENEFTWMNAMIDGGMLYIGPTINIDTPCFECFDYKTQQNLTNCELYDHYRFWSSQKNSFMPPSQPTMEPIDYLLTSFAALEVTNYLLTGANHSLGKCMTIHLPTMEIIHHDILKESSCPVCGLPETPPENSYFDLEALLKEEDNVIDFTRKTQSTTH